MHNIREQINLKYNENSETGMNEGMKFFILHWLKMYTVKKLENNKRHGIRKPAYINQ